MARLLFVICLAACGPGRYLGQVHRADDAVAEARGAHADTLAPYWWTRAIEYLHKAREVAAHADYQGAVRFGRLATDAAHQAADEARLAAKDPQRRPLDGPPPGHVPGVAPAKDAP